MAHLRVFILSGPSGVGKSSIIHAVLAQRPDVQLSVSTTTRDPRPGEQDGRDYHFSDRDTFERMISEGGFLEWARSYDNYYGTGADEIERIHGAGCHALLDVDTQGALQIQRTYTGAVYVFIRPPDLATLEERLRGRGTESEEVVRKRLARAEQEIGNSDKYDHVLVNHVVDDVVRELVGIIDLETARPVDFTRIGNGAYDAIAFTAQKAVRSALTQFDEDALVQALEAEVKLALRAEVEGLVRERLERVLRDELADIVADEWQVYHRR